MNSTQPTSPYPDNRDNDQLWVGGVFYVNPNDPRFLVKKRYGIGWTFNFAYPIGWWLTGGLFAFLGLVQLFFFMIFHNPINLVLLCLFLAPCLPLFIVGSLRVRASRKSFAFRPRSESSIPAIPRLNPSYNGSETSTSGPVTLSIVHQSQDGHLPAKWILNDPAIEYLCEGTITPEGNITLTSTGSHRDSALQIHGSISPDGHLEGTLFAISKDGSSHRHSWSLS